MCNGYQVKDIFKMKTASVLVLCCVIACGHASECGEAPDEKCSYACITHHLTCEDGYVLKKVRGRWAWRDGSCNDKGALCADMTTEQFDQMAGGCGDGQRQCQFSHSMQPIPPNNQCSCSGDCGDPAASGIIYMCELVSTLSLPPAASTTITTTQTTSAAITDSTTLSTTETSTILTTTFQTTTVPSTSTTDMVTTGTSTSSPVSSTVIITTYETTNAPTTTFSTVSTFSTSDTLSTTGSLPTIPSSSSDGSITTSNVDTTSTDITSTSSASTTSTTAPSPSGTNSTTPAHNTTAITSIMSSTASSSAGPSQTSPAEESSTSSASTSRSTDQGSTTLGISTTDGGGLGDDDDNMLAILIGSLVGLFFLILLIAIAVCIWKKRKSPASGRSESKTSLKTGSSVANELYVLPSKLPPSDKSWPDVVPKSDVFRDIEKCPPHDEEGELEDYYGVAAAPHPGLVQHAERFQAAAGAGVSMDAGDGEDIFSVPPAGAAPGEDADYGTYADTSGMMTDEYDYVTHEGSAQKQAKDTDGIEEDYYAVSQPTDPHHVQHPDRFQPTAASSSQVEQSEEYDYAYGHMLGGPMRMQEGTINAGRAIELKPDPASEKNPKQLETNETLMSENLVYG